MVQCSALDCKSNSRHNCRMFRFPIDEHRRRKRKWIINCRRAGWVPGPNARICAAHFEESQYGGQYANGLKKLKRDVVPTIFANHCAPVVFSSTQVKGKGVSTSESVPVDQIRLAFIF